MVTQIDRYEEPTEEHSKGIGDYVSMLGRHRTSIAITFVLIFLLSAIVAALWPPTFRSESTILILQQDIPGNLVQSTITSFASERIHKLEARVMTRRNLWRIIQQYDLYADERRKETTEEIIDQMRTDAKLSPINAEVIDPRNGVPTKAMIAFKVSYDNESPSLALKVANELTTLYINENLKKRTEQAADASRFLAEEADRISSTISKLESILANFKEKEGKSLPEYQPYNVQLVQRLERDITDTTTDIHALEDREFYLKGQLAQIEPFSPVTSDTGLRILPPKDRLKTLKNEYSKLSSRYHSNHPDLVKMKREIASLEDSNGSPSTREVRKELIHLHDELSKMKGLYRPNHPDLLALEKRIKSIESDSNSVTGDPSDKPGLQIEDADNPAFIMLNAQLEGVRNDISVNKMKLDKLKSKLEDAENNLAQSPQVEREYLSLTRDYSNAVLSFREIKAKQIQAGIAQELEREKKGERFELISPPEYPEVPVKPNRLGMVFLGIVFGLVIAVGQATIRETIQGVVHTGKDIARLVGVPPLTTIPYFTNEKELEKKKNTRYISIAGAMATVLLLLTAIHFLFSPLDVLWFRITRKLGIMLF